MTKLLYDRYLRVGEEEAWDVATGVRVVLRSGALEDDRDQKPPGSCIDWGLTPDGGRFEAWELLRSEPTAPSIDALDAVLEALDLGCDGEPRRLQLTARGADARGALARTIAREARRRGYVPLSIEAFAQLRHPLAEELRDRALVLLDGRPKAYEREGVMALARAASMSARPHILVRLEASLRTPRLSLVRERRAVYGVGASASAARSSWPSDLAKWRLAAERATAAARAGRHAAADRQLRETVAALRRRRALVPAAAIGITLGRLRLERGDAAGAERLFDDAATAGEEAGDGALAIDARLWLGLARIDAGRLTAAEALLRALRLSIPPLEGWRRAWADAAVARCLLWQGRDPEALEVLEPMSLDWLEGVTDPVIATAMLGIHVRALLSCGRVFEAGQRARRSVVLAGASGEPLAEIIALTSHLRVLASTGDLWLLEAGVRDVVARARQSHLPLRAVRARLVWLDAVARAGRAAEAAQIRRRLARTARIAMPLIARSIERVPVQPGAEALVPRSESLALPLLRLMQQESSDAEVIGQIAARLVETLRAGRVEFQVGSSAAPIASAGAGLSPRLGVRALEAGVVIGPEQVKGCWEAACPVRAGDRLLAALACRWPLNRVPPVDMAGYLEIAAAIASPRVDALLIARQHVASAAAAIPELVGHSTAISDVRRAAARAAAAPFAVLIVGESGTGKELVARAIHQLGPRRDRPFRDLNCAALPDELVESELFGHARGAFTGALVERRGLFEDAHGGTVFLDELQDLSLRAQAKLLRVIQESEVRRLGETFVRKVDVRLVTATNRSMAEEAEAGRFRRDLLYRLDVIRICLPPLRERPEDIPPLSLHFWESAARRVATSATLSHDVLGALSRYHWPGNVRELQNVIAALAVAAPARGSVGAALLPPAIAGATAVMSVRLADARRQFDRRFVESALARAGGNRARAAAQIGISRQGLLKLLERVGLAPPPAAPQLAIR